MRGEYRRPRTRKWRCACRRNMVRRLPPSHRNLQTPSPGSCPHKSSTRQEDPHMARAQPQLLCHLPLSHHLPNTPACPAHMIAAGINPSKCRPTRTQHILTNLAQQAPLPLTSLVLECRKSLTSLSQEFHMSLPQPSARLYQLMATNFRQHSGPSLAPRAGLGALRFLGLLWDTVTVPCLAVTWAILRLGCHRWATLISRRWVVALG
jgi:hypothetical protein